MAGKKLGESEGLERSYQASMDLRDYQLWVGDAQPVDEAEEFRKKELRELCKGVTYNRDQTDADEEHVANPASAITELRDEEMYCGLEVPPAEDVLGEFPARIIKVSDLMGEFDRQSGGIM
jgi:hypothetical protein